MERIDPKKLYEKMLKNDAIKIILFMLKNSRLKSQLSRSKSKSLVIIYKIKRHSKLNYSTLPLAS